MYEGLDDEARALLDQIAPVTTAGFEDDEDELLDLDLPGTAKPASEEKPAAFDDTKFVKREDFDRVSGALDSIQKMLSARDAVPAPAPTPQRTEPAAPINADEVKRAFNERFFADPAGVLPEIISRMVAGEVLKVQAGQTETNATIARSAATQLRKQYESDYPEYKSVLPQMDKLLAETPLETLAQLMASGKLADVYEDQFFSKAGRIAIKVHREARTRRETTSAPPQLGGMGRAGNVTDIKARSSGQQIRMSDLSPEDREAVIQGRKVGLSAAEVLAQEAN